MGGYSTIGGREYARISREALLMYVRRINFNRNAFPCDFHDPFHVNIHYDKVSKCDTNV